MDDKKEKPSTLEEFIEGANLETTARKARKRPSSKNLLLIINGLNKNNTRNKATFIRLKNDIKADIRKYCAGTNQNIINYLIRRALDDLIKEGMVIVQEIDE